jgi:hypothetical protein
MLVLMYLTYNSFCQAVVSVFSCSAPLNGQRFLTVDMNVQCYTPNHVASLIVSGLLLATICLGLPAIFAFILYKNRRNLYDPRIYSLMGTLFDGFDVDHGTYAWQAIVMLRNFSLVAVMRSVSDSQLQLMGSLLVTVFALALHLAFQPYTVLFYNKLESLSLASVVFAQTMSMALVDASAQAASKIGQADGIGLRTIDGISFTLVVVHLSVILAFMYAFLKPPPQVGARKTRGDTGRRTQAQPVGPSSTGNIKSQKRLAPGAGSVGVEMTAMQARGNPAQSGSNCESKSVDVSTTAVVAASAAAESGNPLAIVAIHPMPGTRLPELDTQFHGTTALAAAVSAQPSAFTHTPPPSGSTVQIGARSASHIGTAAEAPLAMVMGPSRSRQSSQRRLRIVGLTS